MLEEMARDHKKKRDAIKKDASQRHSVSIQIHYTRYRGWRQ